MKTHTPVALRGATIDRSGLRPEARATAHGRTTNHRRGLAAAVAGAFIAIAIGACSPGSSTPLPIGSVVALPSVDASAIASAAAGAALAALDQVDAAIATNTTATGLTADDATSLTALTGGVRTALQTGDTAAAKTAVDSLATKVEGLSAKLTTPTGQQLTAAIAALKAALPAN